MSHQPRMRSSLLRPGGVIMQPEEIKPISEKQYTVRVTNFYGCKDKLEIFNLIFSNFDKKILYIHIPQNLEYCFIGVSSEEDAHELQVLFDRFPFNNMILNTKIIVT